MRLLNEMLDTNNAVLMQRRLMVIKRGEDFDRDYRKAQGCRRLTTPYGPSTSRFRVMPPAIRWSRGSTRHARPPTRPPGNCMRRMKAGDFDGAAKELLAEQGLATAWNEAISTLLRHQEVLTARSREDYRATEAWTGTLSIVFGVLSLILGSLAAWAITAA